MIAFNNIKVATLCFSLAALLGIGGLLLLINNGISIGAVAGFCYANGFYWQLNNFVAAHGPLELTIIVCAAFSGFLMGRVFYLRPYSLLGTRLAIAAKEAGTVLVGILPWLCLAAFFEAFISPWEFISTETKLICGLILAFFFWVWTFWPLEVR